LVAEYGERDVCQRAQAKRYATCASHAARPSTPRPRQLRPRRGAGEVTAFIVRRSRLGAAPRGLKYLVGGQGNIHAYASTLDEAKRVGKAIADREELRGSWNVCFITIPILVADNAPGASVYKHTGWRMYVPVRGTGVHYKDIAERIRKRYNVAPMVWTKN